MKLRVLVFTAVFAAVMSSCFAYKAFSQATDNQVKVQQAAPPPQVEVLKPTEIEQLKIQSQQKDITILIMQYNQHVKESQDAAAAANATLASINATSADLNKYAEQVRKAHGWGEDVKVDTNSGTFSRPVKPADKK